MLDRVHRLSYVTYRNAFDCRLAQFITSVAVCAVELLQRDVLWPYLLFLQILDKFGTESNLSFKSLRQAIPHGKQCKLRVSISCVDFSSLLSRSWVEPAVVRRVEPIEPVEGVYSSARVKQVLLDLPGSLMETS